MEPDQALLDEIAEVRRVVELGRQARSASQLKLRQPLRRLVVAGASRAESHADEIAEELRVKEVEFGDVEASELRVKPNLPVLGPKLGPALREVRERLQRGEFEELAGGRFQVDGHVLEPDEVLVERVGREGWAVASEDGVTVALDTALDDELRLEANLLDRVHEVNVLRKDSGLAITDRIRLWLPDDALIERYARPARGGDARRLGRARRAANRAGMKRLVLPLAAVGLAVAGCGGSNAQPKDDPAAFAVKVVDQIVHNRYSAVWDDLVPADQKVAPAGEYVQCETRSPVLTAPRTRKC